jgi:OHCU decarboxylase
LEALRPFWDVGQLLNLGGRIWRELGVEDWLEAFRAHPKIGESTPQRETGAEAQAWAEGEQSRAREASDATLDALAEANREYEERFGFIFIVCATGKTADEMLALLRGRIDNDPETELRVAAVEQWRITELRVRKFLNVK